MSDPFTNTTVIQADSISTWDPVARRYVDLKNSVAAQATTYSKTEVDARLAVKADQAALDGKADQTDLLAERRRGRQAGRADLCSASVAERGHRWR